MWQRNNGQAEDDLQFRFTAYLVSAVKHRRKDYLIQLYKRSSIESTVEVVYESEPSSEEVVLDKLPLMDVIENGALLEALQKLNERERQIFLARTLEEEDFETLGVKFELSYKGAAALYYRTIQKIRKSIEVQLINVNSKMRKNLFYFLTKKGRTFPLVKISFFERY